MEFRTKFNLKYLIEHNGWQLNADFVFHKICDLGAVSSLVFKLFERGINN